MSAAQRLVAVLLLALTGVLGVAASEASAPAAAMPAVPAVEPAAWPGEAAHVALDDAVSRSSDTISLLCVCALFVVTVLLVKGLGSPLRRQGRRLGMAARHSLVRLVSSPVPLSSPWSWGVCQQ
ncbi:hypothetical protein [Promicromonospora umidemergens]|uniref:hypothetical protein n=1 Tax=Promicromonospora umidemergens TaxID=629679 RepID=UPI0020A55B1C|nr:hypothetical protein [Promicromonospora umidemergens]